MFEFEKEIKKKRKKKKLKKKQEERKKWIAQMDKALAMTPLANRLKRRFDALAIPRPVEPFRVFAAAHERKDGYASDAWEH